ncbi:regulatory LuxR family protein [Stackebrandtia endophytica]|uniref:Regulatory LuxR family protein n=1 Tax=Stackebrandtia endophytica TaxID=1496996 RepID=A0A543ARP0_9ACTN|nr:regulatory LuxR family protein [Stackebrandtia endophytica]
MWSTPRNQSRFAGVITGETSKGSAVPPAQPDLLARVDRARDPLGLFAILSKGMGHLVPFDAAVWRTVDPLTGLTTAPLRVDNLTEEGCAVYWQSELFEETVNRFTDLAELPVPAAGLRETVGGLPTRSSLYRDFMRPRGLEDELRVVLRVDGAPWGQISLFRERGRRAFDSADTDVLGRMSAPLARRLRGFSRIPATSEPLRHSEPGVLLFDAAANLISINDAAAEHLTQVPEGPTVPTAWGVDIPIWILTTVLRLRKPPFSQRHPGPRIRLRTRTGRWLVCHASSLRDAAGVVTGGTVVIEPAQATEVAELIMAAYELSQRELDITALVAKGHATAQIAARLYISPHTVRDHLKVVFEKVQVSSRGELVARIFTDQLLSSVEEGTERHLT